MHYTSTKTETKVFVFSKDTDVLDWMVFLYVLNKIYEKQAMKISSNKFINTRKIVEYLGTNVATKFPQIYPQIHAATVRDTTSFLHFVGKIKESQ